MRVSLLLIVALLATAYALVSADNKEDGEMWLAEVAQRDGITRLPSGLLYEVVTAGSGAYPTRESRVQVHYRGTLQDGSTFDSSYDRGSPATFGVTQVIKGWTEALLLMREGDKWQVWIPSELAYGSRGAGGQIKANAALSFTIELLAVQGAKRDLL